MRYVKKLEGVANCTSFFWSFSGQTGSWCDFFTGCLRVYLGNGNMARYDSHYHFWIMTQVYWYVVTKQLQVAFSFLCGSKYSVNCNWCDQLGLLRNDISRRKSENLKSFFKSTTKIPIWRQTLFTCLKYQMCIWLKTGLGETTDFQLAESFDVSEICCAFLQGSNQCTYCIGISWLLQLR